MFVQVWDSSLLVSNEKLGEVKFPVSPFRREERRLVFKLYHEDIEDPGHIDLSLYYSPDGFSSESKQVCLISLLFFV